MRSRGMMPRFLMTVAVAIAITSGFYGTISSGLADTSVAERAGSFLNSPLIGFAENLFREVSDPDKNVVMSPISIHLALNMLLLGAEPSSPAGAELLRTLNYYRYDSEVEKLNKAYRDLLNDFKRLNELSKSGQSKKHLKGKGKRSKNGTTKEIELNVWSMVITKDDFTPKPKYLENIQIRTNGSLRQVNKDKPEQTKQLLDEINKWAKDAGFEKDVLDEKEISGRDFTMLLLSAINMEAHWFDKFHVIDYKPSDAERSEAGPSLLKEGMKCLQNKEYRVVVFRFGLSTRRNFRAIKIPLKFGVNFVILEPGKYDELDNLEDEILMRPGRLQEILSLASFFEEETYGVTLPKFKFESDLDLNKPLNSIGLREIFKNGTSLSGITDVPRQVDSVKHRACVEVNEFGVKAAAVTKVSFPISARLKPAEMLFIRNPFMFVIEYDGTPLFIGHVVSV